MQLKLEQLARECDADIRAGNIHLVSRRLQSFNFRKIPRSARLELAKICRRAGLISLGMKMLTPVIHPRERDQEPATHQEQAEYAVLLTRAGALREAAEILSRVDTDAVPEALLYAAYTHFEQWEFAPAVPKLESYLARIADNYQKLVGRVNLAYALVRTNRVAEAEALLFENIEMTRSGHNRLLEIYCFELLTRLYVNQQDSDKASQSLFKARALVTEPNGPQMMMLRKWEAIISAAENQRLDRLLAFRDELLTRKEWEHVREVDRYSLKIQFDRYRFEYLVFGTPYNSFRAQVCGETGQSPSGAGFVLGPAGSRCLDVVTGDVDDVRAIAQGRKCHQLIEVLLRDFYRPMKLGQLFVELFPGQYYDIFSSPNRVHQVVFRTREWISAHQLPIHIDEVKGYYSLRTTGPFSFRVPYTKKNLSIYDDLMRELKAKVTQGQKLAPKEIRQLLGIPRTTFFRFSNWAVDNGRLERLGNSSATRYKLGAA